MSTLRRLRPLILPKNATKKDPGPPPAPILLKASQLRINDEYQRALSRDSSRLAAKIAQEFDWELFHLPVVSPLDEIDDVTGLPLYEVLDGQHTSIAAVTNGHIKELWCWPGRVSETVESRAESFNKLNTQRTAITPVELFWANVTAKEENALDVIEACDRAGASIVKRPKPYGDMRVGETICTAPLISLARKGGVAYVARVLRVAVGLRLAPISHLWIKALAELLVEKSSPHYVDGVSSIVDLEVTNAINRRGVDNLLKTARMSHASSTGSDREAIHWFLAYHIKREVDAHGSR